MTNNLHAKLDSIQYEATTLEGVLEGAQILLDEGDHGRNAAVALVRVALEKAALINSAVEALSGPMGEVAA